MGKIGVHFSASAAGRPSHHSGLSRSGRRQSSQSAAEHEENPYGEVMDDYIDADAIAKYGLDDETIAKSIAGYDVVTTGIKDLRTIIDGLGTPKAIWAAAPYLLDRDLPEPGPLDPRPADPQPADPGPLVAHPEPATGEPTGLTPLPSCKDFPGQVGTNKICRDWWHKKRTYVCDSEQYDFSDVATRFGQVVSSASDNTSNLTFQDPRLGPTGWSIANGSINLPQRDPASECEVACKTRIAKTDTQVTTTGTVTGRGTVSDTSHASSGPASAPSAAKATLSP